MSYKTFRIIVSYSILFSALFCLHIGFLGEWLKKTVVLLYNVHNVLQQAQNQKYIHPSNIPPFNLRTKKLTKLDNSSTLNPTPTETLDIDIK